MLYLATYINISENQVHNNIYMSDSDISGNRTYTL